MPVFICPERLYFDEFKREVVRAGDPRASYLFRAVGQPISDAELKEYRIMDVLTAPSHEDKSAKPDETPMQKLERSITVEEQPKENKGDEPDASKTEPDGSDAEGDEKDKE